MKRLLSALALFSLLFSGAALAEARTYSQEAFDALQKDGKPTLVEIHATWCSTCRAQAPIINSLLKEKEFAGITALHVDYDDQKDVVRSFRVQRQATLIVFKDGKEVGRSTSDTSREGIRKLLQKAL
ncbi:MAG: thioredoxin [Betaproteobacteria bacterium HGW-Betaproteobacteria-1]|jgi:thiol-disulfide isomerase/thioredoxin|nr:MAG: thioredoxin [Betaproteobacteria bacterium HGW-Betaproteobacteria-1]